MTTEHKTEPLRLPNSEVDWAMHKTIEALFDRTIEGRKELRLARTRLAKAEAEWAKMEDEWDGWEEVAEHIAIPLQRFVRPKDDGRSSEEIAAAKRRGEE